MSLSAGRLRHRITIEAKVTTKDANGSAITAWQPWASVWAEVAPLSAREFIGAHAMQSEVSARITIRYRPGMLATMRLIHRGQVYSIAGVLPDNVSGLEYITLPVSVGANNG